MDSIVIGNKLYKVNFSFESITEKDCYFVVCTRGNTKHIMKFRVKYNGSAFIEDLTDDEYRIGKIYLEYYNDEMVTE